MLKFTLMVSQYTRKILSNLRTNQEFILSEEEHYLKNEMLHVCHELTRIRKQLSYKRFYGKDIDPKDSLPFIFCKQNFRWRKVKTKNEAPDTIPLINKFPSSTQKCSWDTSKDKRIVNIVVHLAKSLINTVQFAVETTFIKHN